MTFLEFLGVMVIAIFIGVGLHFFIKITVHEAIQSSMPWGVTWDEEKIGEIYNKKNK